VNDMTIDNSNKAGIAVLIGRSNVGKSTLLNSLVDQKVSITSPLPQTTRLPVQGVLTTDTGQIVFVDTPGLIRGPKDLLTARLNEIVRQSLAGVDCVLYVVDPTRPIGSEERQLLAQVRAVDKPKILVINKSDIQDTEYREDYRDLWREFSAGIEVSALKRHNLKALIDICMQYLPEGEPLYPLDQKTDISREVWMAEVIREKLYFYLHKEVPYTATVSVEEISERENGTLYVRALVLTTSPHYRKMIIGSQAHRIKEIGIAARKELTVALNRPIYLDLRVDVDPHWQEYTKFMKW